jgi:SAM-dependent methyltransferase
MIHELMPKNVAFLGFDSENEFTRTLPGVHTFFDLSLGNWEINSAWTLPSSYDLIVSTRCPYFACDPADFIRRCQRHITNKGNIFIDWGLGDHWRFPMYKVGWVRNGEHEFAYSNNNYLHSCLWRSEFQDVPEVIKFWDHIRGRYGYDVDAKLDDVVKAEIPSIVDYKFDKIKFKFLWPDSPQLYIMTLL